MRSISFFTVLLLLSATACNNLSDLTVSPLQPVLAFPLLHSNATLAEMIDVVDTAGFVELLPDGCMQLRYKGETRVDGALDFFSFLQVAPVTDTFVRVPMSSDIFKVRVDSAYIKAGTITAVINNGFSAGDPKMPVPFTMYIPNLKKNGVLFQKDFIAPIDQSASLVADISDYTLVPVDDSITIYYDAINAYGQSVKFDGFGLLTNGSLVAKYAQGYLGKQVQQNFQDTIDIALFQDLPDAAYNFANPKLTLICENSWGVSVKIIINTAKWVSADGTAFNLESEFINPANPDNGVLINSPNINEVGQTKYTTFVLDKDNSNIEDLINTKPVKLIYNIQPITNPNDNPDEVSFMIDTSSLVTRFDLELPLFGSVENQFYNDTFPLNLSDSINLDVAIVDSVEFKIITQNEIPFTSNLTLHLLDANMQSIGTVGQQNIVILAAPSIDPVTSITTGAAYNVTYVNLDHSQINMLTTAKFMVMQLNFSTAGGPGVPVMAKADNRLKIDVGVKLKLL